jgi:alpha-beta hydrolase superfamily lysophospholipase
VTLGVWTARRVITPPRARKDDVQVLGLDENTGTITLERTPETVVDGHYGFSFGSGSGYALVGPILSEDRHRITRRFEGTRFGALAAGCRGRMSGWFFLDPGDAGLDYDEVEIATELGPAPAWFVRAATDTGRWAILVHGRAASRAETIRAVPVFREAGYHCLLVSYRNDPGAPASPDGRYALGDTEWRDVDAALARAVADGATSVVLMGWSMGGATALQTATRSERAGAIAGIVLESPVVDWITALEYQARSEGLARPIRSLVYSLLGGAWAGPLTRQSAPIDFSRLDFVERAGELSVPVLILHSDDDGVIPSSASRALALARPDIVTLEPFIVARHTRLWNYDRRRWSGAISRWLAALGAPQA